MMFLSVKKSLLYPPQNNYGKAIVRDIGFSCSNLCKADTCL